MAINIEEIKDIVISLRADIIKEEHSRIKEFIKLYIQEANLTSEIEAYYKVLELLDKGE